MPRSTLTEARTTTTASAVDGSPGRFRIDLITPGWGTSGYYSPEVLEAAATAGVFPAGMHMYVDHPRGDGSGVDIHGNRSIQDLAAVLSESARWEDGALVADATVFGPYRDVLAQMADSIGVSVRATADISVGEAEGRRGTIVTELVEGLSADFVTRPGRGGRIAAVIESARQAVGDLPAEVLEDLQLLEAGGAAAHPGTTERLMTYWAEGEGAAKIQWGVDGDFNRCVSHLGKYVADPKGLCSNLHVRATGARPGHAATESGLVSEATANDIRDQLDTLLSEQYGGDKRSAYVRDFDDDTVWFQIWNGDDSTESGTYAQPYSSDSQGAIALGDHDRIPVRIVTTYVPVNPAGQSTTTESEEDTMPQIEESRLRELEEAHGRVPTLESERDTERQRAEALEAERNQARTELAAERARGTAVTHVRARVTAANGDLPAATVDRIVAESTATVPLTEAGALDTAALDTAADQVREREETYLAGLAESRGFGRPRGITGRTGTGTQATGGDTGKAEVTEADVQAIIRRRAGTEQKGA